jgi:hypothetical protein
MQKGLSNAIANAVSGDPFYFTGDHCTWCPGAGVCKKLAEENMLSAKQVFSPVEEEVKRATDLDRPLLPDPNSMSPNELAAVLQRAPLFTSWLKAVDEKAQELFREGRKFKGMKAVLPMSRRVITDQEKLATALKKAGAKAKDIWADPKLKPLGHLERLDDKAYADIVNAHCHKPEKQPILVSELDPREAIPSVREVFSAIEEEKPKAKKTKRPKSKDAGGLLD